MRETLFARWISLPAWARLFAVGAVLVGAIGLIYRVGIRVKGKADSRISLGFIGDSGQSDEEDITPQRSSSEKEVPLGNSSTESSPLSGEGLLIERDEADLSAPGPKSPSMAAQGPDSSLEIPLPPTPSLNRPTSAPPEDEPSPPPSAQPERTSPPRESTSVSLAAKASPSPSVDILDEVPPGDANSPIKLAHYRYVLASTSFETSPSRENHLGRVAALERLTQAACLPPIPRSVPSREPTSAAMGTFLESLKPRSLSNRDPSSEPLCLAAINRLLSINPGSTSAICARDGIESPSCYAADADTSFEVDSSSLEKAELVDQTTKATIRSIEQQLSKNRATIRAEYSLASEEKKAALKGEATELAKKLLSVACATRQISVRERPSVESKDFSERSDPFGISDFLKEQEQQVEKNVPTEPNDAYPSAEQEVFERTRPGQPALPSSARKKQDKREQLPEKPLGLVTIISPECQSAIETARSTDPTIPLLPCAERGFYSPRCIRSLRAARDAARRSSTSPEEKSSSGFSRF